MPKRLLLFYAHFLYNPPLNYTPPQGYAPVEVPSLIPASVPQPPAAPISQPSVLKNDAQEPVSSSNPSAFFNAQPPVAPLAYVPNAAPLANEAALKGLKHLLNSYLQNLEEECQVSPEDITKRHKRDVAQKLINCLEIKSYSVSVEFTDEEKAACNEDSGLMELVDKVKTICSDLKDKLLPPSKGFGYSH